jgi:hypothetical protein
MLFCLADLHMPEMRRETSGTLIFTGILPVPGHSKVYAESGKDDLADDEPPDNNKYEVPPFHDCFQSDVNLTLGLLFNQGKKILSRPGNIISS